MNKKIRVAICRHCGGEWTPPHGAGLCIFPPPKRVLAPVTVTVGSKEWKALTKGAK